MSPEAVESPERDKDAFGVDGNHITSSRHTVPTLGDVPICLGCGFMSQTPHGEKAVIGRPTLCRECFDRRTREQQLGEVCFRAFGGDCIHETARCPALRGTKYRMIKEGTAVLGECTTCKRCERYRATEKFDQQRGTTVSMASVGGMESP